MDYRFSPPATKEEFLEKVKNVSEMGATGVLNSLEHKRAATVKALDIEIEFYKAVIKFRKTGDVEWPIKEQNNG